MSFLFPLYFLGAAALAVPLLLHLRKRPPKDRTPFSSLMFLEKSPQKLTRRTKLEKWLLLALRCLALLLLALMFARPFFSGPSLATATAEGRRMALLIDGSASMRRSDLWVQAIARAEQELRGLTGGDEAMVIVFDERDRVIIGFETWRELPPAERLGFVVAELGETAPSWRATGLGRALTNAIEGMLDREVTDAASGRRFAKKEVVVISDFQEGSERDSLGRLAWPEEVALRSVIVANGGGTNFSLHATGGKIEEGEQNARPGRGVRVRVASSRSGQVGKFSLAWLDGASPAGGKVGGNLSPGSVRMVMAPPLADELAGGVLEVRGDDFPFDNRVYVAPMQPRPVNILYLGEDVAAVDAGSPWYYLSRALGGNAAVEPSLEARQAGEVTATADLEGFDVVVLTGGWEPSLGEILAQFVRGAGGVVVCALAADTGKDGLQALTGLEGLEVSEAEDDDYAMLANLDFGHPVLLPFAEAQVRDFSKVHFWRHRVLTLPAPLREEGEVAVFASFDDGSPAWVEFGQGRGKVYLMMSGWAPEESQLALSSKFVPLLFSILAEAGFSARKPPPVYVGGGIPVGKARWVETADGSGPVELPQGQRMFSATEQPGFYTLSGRTGDGAETAITYAVNLAPAESRVDVFDPQTLADFGIVMERADAGGGAVAAGQQKRRLELVEKERGQKAWKWVVLGLLAALWLETWVAGYGNKSEEWQIVK